MSVILATHLIIIKFYRFIYQVSYIVSAVQCSDVNLPGLTCLHNHRHRRSGKCKIVSFHFNSSIFNFSLIMLPLVDVVI